MKVTKTMLVSCVSTARNNWNRKCQIRWQGVRFSQWYWWRFKSFGKLFPLVNRYWCQKEACCFHVQSLCSPRRNRSWRQRDPKKKSVTLYQPTYNCINIDQVEKDIHGPCPLKADWDPSFLSCHVVNIILFITAKDLFIILLENASTGL
jgi:hypothetical protein